MPESTKASSRASKRTEVHSRTTSWHLMSESRLWTTATRRNPDLVLTTVRELALSSSPAKYHGPFYLVQHQNLQMHYTSDELKANAGAGRFTEFTSGLLGVIRRDVYLLSIHTRTVMNTRVLVFRARASVDPAKHDITLRSEPQIKPHLCKSILLSSLSEVPEHTSPRNLNRHFQLPRY